MDLIFFSIKKSAMGRQFKRDLNGRSLIRRSMFQFHIACCLNRGTQTFARLQDWKIFPCSKICFDLCHCVYFTTGFTKSGEKSRNFVATLPLFLLRLPLSAVGGCGRFWLTRGHWSQGKTSDLGNPDIAKRVRFMPFCFAFGVFRLSMLHVCRNKILFA